MFQLYIRKQEVTFHGRHLEVSRSTSMGRINLEISAIHRHFYEHSAAESDGSLIHTVAHSLLFESLSEMTWFFKYHDPG